MRLKDQVNARDNCKLCHITTPVGHTFISFINILPLDRQDTHVCILSYPDPRLSP